MESFEIPRLTKYESLVERLRRQIKSGELKIGARLPSHAQYREDLALTQPTVDRAHAILEREGLIERIPRRGTYVRSSRPHRDSSLLAHTIVVLNESNLSTIVGHAQTGWSDHIIAGLGQAARSRELGLYALSPKTQPETVLRRLTENPPYGVLIPEVYDADTVLASAKALSAAGIPVVVHADGEEFATYDRVISDHETGACELVRWLANHGRERIVEIWTAETNRYWSGSRRVGYERGMSEAGLPPWPRVPIPQGDNDCYTPESYANFVRHCAGFLIEVLSVQPSPDALLVTSDGEAIAVAAACRLLGKKPGLDVLIAGYDNYWRDTLKYSGAMERISVTVNKRNAAIGRRLVELLEDRVQDRLPTGPQRVVMPVRIVETA